MTFRNGLELHADIPFGKILMGLRQLSDSPTKTDKKKVRANFSMLGVERRTQSNGYISYVLWKDSDSPITVFQANKLKQDVIVKFNKNDAITLQFKIGRTEFVLGIELILLSLPNFFNDIRNLINFRGSRVLLTHLMGSHLDTYTLPILETHDHQFQLVPLNDDLKQLAEFLDSSSQHSSSHSHAATNSSLSSEAEKSAWKVWNWRLNDFHPSYDIVDHDLDLYNGQADPSVDDFMGLDFYDEGLDDLEPYFPLNGGCYRSEYKVYPKEFILSLRNAPLSRRKPVDLSRSCPAAKSYNGYHCISGQYVDLGEEEETIKYSRRFLLSLRFSPLSMRRPICMERAHQSNGKPRIRCFRQRY